MDTLLEQCTFLIICRSVLLIMRNVSDKRCREHQNTHFIFDNLFSKIVPFMRMWKNIVEPERSQTMRTRIACWMIKGINTHSAYTNIILIAFPPPQWLHEHISILRLYVHSLVYGFLMQSTRYSCQILMKRETSRQIFEKYS
jgi:hypothetical protein